MTEERNSDQGRTRATLFWNLIQRYGIVVVVAVFFVTANLHFSYTPDDTYIYLQYAKNIARDEGFSFNAGSPSYGVTGPLWVLLIAGGTGLGLDPYIVAKTLDVILASLAILAAYALAFAIIRDRIYALVAAWVLSFDSWFLRWASSGMETSFAVLLALVAAWYAYRKEYIVASLVAGLLTLVRPEGALLFVAMLLDNLLNTRDRTAKRRALAGSVVTYGVIVSVWLLFAYVQLGSIVPNTLQAKSTIQTSLSVLWFTTFSCLKILGATQGIAVLFIALGVVVTVRKYGWKIIREEGFLILWVLLLLTAYILLNVQVVSRYLVLVLPFIAIYGMWGIKRLEIASVLSSRQALLTLLIVAGLLLTQNQYVYRSRVVPHMENFTMGMSECLKPIAYWLRTHAETDATVLTPDVGILGYISDRTVVETAGLVTPDMKRAFRGISYDEGMKQGRYLQILLPDYIVDRSPRPERLASDSIRPVMTRPFSGLGLTKSDPVYYTLYKVSK
ncbi:MAG: hypothetical protein FJ217_10075 [Ignavibacteria bacterium]|nr:hypothetical protein [Ignavibacteria bacterium]